MKSNDIRQKIKELYIELKITQICKEEGKEKSQYIKKIKADIACLEKQLET